MAHDIEKEPISRGDRVIGEFEVTAVHGDVISISPRDPTGQKQPSYPIEGRLVKVKSKADAE